ncbi:annexin A7-like [Mytilus californianus]|uniref:annexin A7-like n=1 Tax=Mytilus californianus TaxID=6549 RepID=UPI002246DEC0|nr:annexin A7-like [Mytilus californianus]
MAFYQSNYPGGGGGYGGYGGGGYGGGPPPPPGGGYGNAAYPGGGYGGGYGGAYNVNASPYGGFGVGGYLTGSAPPPGGQHGYTGGYTNSNGYGNFTAAMGCQQTYAGHQQVAPPPAPPSVYQNGIDQQMASMHQGMQQLMRQQAEMEFRAQEKENRGRRRRRKKRRDDEEEEDEEEDEEDEEEDSGPREEDIKERVKAFYIAELLRRIDRSGTLDVTSGTIVGYPYYTKDDPVLEFNTKKNGYEFDPDKPLKWDPELDCEYLREALKGWGTNEDAIIHVITTRCNAQRQELKKAFKTSYGRDLIKDLKGDLSFNFETAVLALFVPPAEYDAWAIKEAIYGPGTDERALMEILLTRTNPQIQAIRDCYNNVASPNSKKKEGLIDKDIEDDCSGDFKRLLVSAAQGNRSHISEEKLKNAVEELMSDGNPTGMFEVNFDKLCDINRAKADAKNLFKAGEDKWGTDEETFVRIFACRDYYQLRATYNEYVKITQRDIENSVSRETSGDFERGLLSIVKNIKCRPRFFADELTSSMKGLGTKDNRLIRIIVSRSEIDMVQIKKHFLENNKQTLWKWLKDDCSGDYKKLLQAIVGKD